MTAKTARINSILTSVMLFLYAGCIVLNVLLALLTRHTLLTLPAGILLCLSVLIPAILLCRQAKQGKDRTAKILSVLSLIVSMVWTLVSGLYWMLTIARSLIVEIYLRMSMPMMSMEQLFRLLNFLGIAYAVFTTLVALGLMIKKQTDTAQDAQPTRENQAQQPSDIPFHLPAGVNADDI